MKIRAWLQRVKFANAAGHIKRQLAPTFPVNRYARPLITDRFVLYIHIYIQYTYMYTIYTTSIYFIYMLKLQ